MTATNTTRSFKLPGSMELDINKKIVAEGYGLRGKSKWICDAIVNFLRCSDVAFVIESVEYADELVQLNKSISFRPTDEVEDLLRTWVVQMRQVHPEMDGAKSKIIRTAVIHALLGSIASIKRLESAQAS